MAYKPAPAGSTCDKCNDPAAYLVAAKPLCGYHFDAFISAIEHRVATRDANETAAEEWDGDPEPATEDDELAGMLIKWDDFWTHDHGDEDWIAEPLIPSKRSVAIFAPGGTGKSLLALWLAAAIATGRPILGQPAQRPRHVLYLDYEMTPDDLAERLENMGYGPDNDLSHLHYALLPALPGLDKAEGGRAVIRLAQLCDAELVVIDTFGRAVHGDENDADTVRAWYRWTGLHLKAEGRAFVRVDHSGKDIAKGQRGTSAKNDDVDVVWQLTAKDGDLFRMSSKHKRRMGWVPLEVDLQRYEDAHGLRYELSDAPQYPAGTAGAVALLDGLKVPEDAGRNTARQAIKDAGQTGVKTSVLSAAVKFRKRRSQQAEIDTSGMRSVLDTRTNLRASTDNNSQAHNLPNGNGDRSKLPLSPKSGDSREHPAKPLVDEGDRSGDRWGQVQFVDGDRSVPPKGDSLAQTDSDTLTAPDDDCPF